MGLDVSVLSFAICSTTASVEQLLVSSLEIIDAPRLPEDRRQGIKGSNTLDSLSQIWQDEKAFEELKDSVVNMFKNEADVEGLANRHQVRQSSGITSTLR